MPPVPELDANTIARTEISVKLSLQSKLGDLLHWSSNKSLSKTNVVQAKAIVTSEVSYSISSK